MIKEGDMVRLGGQPPMLVRHIFRGMAHCQLVDQNGRIINRFAYLRDLAPLWLSFTTKSVWPEPDRMIMTEDEDVAEIKRRSAPAVARKKATKPKRSNKLVRSAKVLTASRFDAVVGATA